MLALTEISNYVTLKGSFSAVSKPNFSSKYALEDLQNALLCTVLESNPKKRGKPWGEKILVQSRENRPRSLISKVSSNFAIVKHHCLLIFFVKDRQNVFAIE